MGKPHAAFVWEGLDCIERIQIDTDALARGDVHYVGTQADLDGSGIAVGGSGSTAAAAARRPCPLVSATVVAQRFTANDVLREGPPPAWYNQGVAKAGIKALHKGGVGKRCKLKLR